RIGTHYEGPGRFTSVGVGMALEGCCHPLTPERLRFFFQAEDGIRDWSVTGVQTCAFRSESGRCSTVRDREPSHRSPAVRRRRRRSEERRVGKECRSRGAPDHEKKKKNSEPSTLPVGGGAAAALSGDIEDGPDAV